MIAHISIPLPIWLDLINTLDQLFAALNNNDAEQSQFILFYLQEVTQEIKDSGYGNGCAGDGGVFYSGRD
jgi:hypothetical protein